MLANLRGDGVLLVGKEGAWHFSRDRAARNPRFRIAPIAIQPLAHTAQSLAISDAPSPPGISRSARRATFRPMSTTPIDGRCTFEGQRTKIYLRS